MEKQKIASRIAHLLKVRESNPIMYSINRLGVEKENLMIQYGNDKEIMQKVREILK